MGVIEKHEVQRPPTKRTKPNLGIVGTGVNQEAWLHAANHTHGSAAGSPCTNPSPHETTKPIFFGLSEPATNASVVDETVLAVLG